MKKCRITVMKMSCYQDLIDLYENPMEHACDMKPGQLSLIHISGLIAHKIGRINESSDTKHVFFWTLMACLGSLGFNVIFDPIFGYFYKTFILGVQTDVAKIVSTWAAGVTAINAAVCTVVVTALYMALRPALKKSGLMARFLPSAKKAGQ